MISGLAAVLTLASACAAPAPSASMEQPAQVTHEVVKTVEVMTSPPVEAGAARTEAPAIIQTSAAQPLPTLTSTSPEQAAPAALSTPAVSANKDQASPSPPILVTALPEKPLSPTNPPPPASPSLPTLPPLGTIAEVEWPGILRLGESDLVRLSLVPAAQGYTLVTEYPEHSVLTQTLAIPRPPGYAVTAIARLDGPAFDVQPSAEQTQSFSGDSRLDWRWALTARQSGRQRLSLTLRLHWEPETPQAGKRQEVTLFSRGLEVQVVSFLGLTRFQALWAGLFSLLFGGGMGAALVITRPRPRQLPALLTPAPNPALQIELPPELRLRADERTLLNTLFHRYGRLVIEHEFLSGYSGARAFLARPIHPDGRADAYTIAKLGEASSIQHEFANYETYVKDTLPPITARIQHPPVSTRSAVPTIPRLAAVQYTFIGQAGQAPSSLRQALLEHPDPQLLYKLLDTFGPSWWLQRHPYTFRAAQEYDRLLPAHYLLTPYQPSAHTAAPPSILDGRLAPGQTNLAVGDIVQIKHFTLVEQRPDEARQSLYGLPPAGQPALRLRWLSDKPAHNALAQVQDTRQTLLAGLAGAGLELVRQQGWPDPLTSLPGWLSETVPGSRSTIHGDLNLENILLGPGGLVWLIDFAQTRDGHTLLDFAHLYAELTTHILAPQIAQPEALMDLFRQPQRGPYAALGALLQSVDAMAQRCLFNPANRNEWQLARSLACLGALKYRNLDSWQRAALYLAAAQPAII